jgi:hypothetical protein
MKACDDGEFFHGELFGGLLVTMAATAFDLGCVTQMFLAGKATTTTDTVNNMYGMEIIAELPSFDTPMYLYYNTGVSNHGRSALMVVPLSEISLPLSRA